MFNSNNITYEQVVAIQRKANIVDIISEYISLTKKGKNYKGVCPFHDDHSPSMTVSEEKQIYSCFSCGNSGNVFHFIMEYEKVSYYEAVKIVADKIGMSFSYSKKENKVSEDNKKLYEIYDFASKFYQNNLNTSFGQTAKEYLVKRKIDDELIKKFNIGLSLSDSELYSVLKSKGFKDEEIVSSALGYKSNNKMFDLYKNRIMFPLYDLEGRVNGFSGREYFEKTDRKYINTSETKIFKKGELLYNYHIAKKIARKEKCIIVVEGFMDVIRLSSIGIDNVVATMGTEVTKFQANLINKLAPKIILLFDGDSAGQKATINYLRKYANGLDNIKVVRLEEKLDPDEYILKYGKEKMIYQLTHPIDAYDFNISILKNNLNLSDSKDISNFINLATKELSNIKDDVILDLEINKLSKLTGVDKKVIESKINKNEENINIKITTEKEEKENKYDKASKYILYRMIHDNKIIQYYYNELSYLPNELDRKLANEIVLFYKKYKSFNVDDFIIYLQDNKDLINLLIRVDNNNYTNNELIDNIDNYFKVIKEYLYKVQIKKLTNDLKIEMNEVKRREIAKKIVEIKLKECIKDE